MIEHEILIIIDVSGWEIEFMLPIEYSVNPGYAQTRWEPGEPAHIEDINCEESDIIELLLKEVSGAVSEYKEGISFCVEDVLKEITEYINQDDTLHYELMDHAEKMRHEYELDY